MTDGHRKQLLTANPLEGTLLFSSAMVCYIIIFSHVHIIMVGVSNPQLKDPEKYCNGLHFVAPLPSFENVYDENLDRGTICKMQYYLKYVIPPATRL